MFAEANVELDNNITVVMPKAAYLKVLSDVLDNTKLRTIGKYMKIFYKIFFFRIQSISYLLISFFSELHSLEFHKSLIRIYKHKNEHIDI